MEKEETIVDSPIAVGEVTLVPIAKISLDYASSDRAGFLFGMKWPVAIVAISVSGRRAFRMTGEEVSVQELVQELPGVKETLEGM
jgi:uncharacterized spore protein YtfJ